MSIKHKQKSQLCFKHYIKKLVVGFFPLCWEAFFPGVENLSLKNHQKPDFDILAAQ